MERWFGMSLQDIRVHDDHAAASLADRWNARAITHGSDIYFGPGMYRPDRFEGRRLLGHEIAHSLQQRGSSTEIADRHHEVEAHRAGDAIAAGHGWNVHTSARPGQLQLDSKAPPRKAGITTDPELPTSALLDLVTLRLDELEATNATGVDRALTRLRSVTRAATTAGGKDSTVERQGRLRQIAARLNEYLVQITPKLAALASMEDPKNYLPNLADRIVKSVHDCESAYVQALLAADTTDDNTETFDLAAQEADRQLTELPHYIVWEYLQTDEGVPQLIRRIKPEVEALNRLRQVTGKQPFSDQKAEDLLRLYLPGSTALNPTSLINQLMGGFKNIREDFYKHQDVTEPLRDLVIHVQQVLGLIQGMQIFEQLDAYDQGLDNWINDIMEGTFWSNVQTQIRQYKRRTADLLSRLAVGGPFDEKVETQVRDALRDMASMLDPSFTAATDKAADRLHTIAIIRFVGKSIAITAVAALTAGVASEYAAAYVTEQGAADLAGTAAFVAKVVTFTAVSRGGQNLLLDGGAQGSVVGDLVTNALMFGMLDKINNVFSALAKRVPKAWKIPLGIGKFATGMIALQSFAEVETVFKGGTAFKDFGASALQNLVMMVALEAGGFIAEPLVKRLVAPAIKARFEAAWRDLETSRADIHDRVLALSRGTLKPEQVADLLRDIYLQWGAELRLLNEATQGKGKEKPILSDAEAKEILSKYQAKLAELELRLSKLNLELPVSLGAPPGMFRPLTRGLVGFSRDPKARDMIADMYQKVPGGSFKRSTSSAFPDMWEGRLPNGELTYYIPLEATAGKIPKPSKVVVARDAAVGASAGDEEAERGMQRLRNSFNDLKIDEILASVKDGDVAGFLRFIADPGLAGGKVRAWGADWFRRVADSPEAVQFGRRYGGKALRNLTTLFGWTPELTKTLGAIDALAEAAPDAAPAMIDQVTKAKKTADIDALLGKPKPVKPPKPRVRATKTKLSVDRTRASWTTFRAEAAKFATTHQQTPTDAQLDLRADLYQFIADAKAGRFKRFSDKSLVNFLDAFDAVAKDAGMLQPWINALRGNVLAEALFIPDYGKAKSVFYKGKLETGSRPAGSTEPDYSLPGKGFIEWVNLKSDLIDSNPKAAKDAARAYLDKAKLEASNLPPGDKYSLHFIRTPPDKKTIQAMLDILFAKGSPIYRVKIGRTWYDAKGPVSP
jgi:hypothetical protein